MGTPIDSNKLSSKLRSPQEQLIDAGIGRTYLVPLFVKEVSSRIERSSDGITDASYYKLSESAHEPFDINFTLFENRSAGGVFVVCNGYGMGANTIDELRSNGETNIRGFADLKKHFSSEKFLECFKMALVECPDMRSLTVNVVSGTAQGGNLARAINEFFEFAQKQGRGDIAVSARFVGPNADLFHSLIDQSPHRSSISVAYSTSGLVRQETEHIVVDDVQAAFIEALTDNLESKVRSAMERRAEFASIEPPEFPDSRLNLGYLLSLNREAHIGVVGFGQTAQYHLRIAQEHGAKIAWAIRPDQAKWESTWDFPFYTQIEDAFSKHTCPEILINYSPAEAWGETMHTLVEQLKKIPLDQRPRMVLSAAENIPAGITAAYLGELKQLEVFHLGPNSPGLMLVDKGDDETVKLTKIGNLSPLMFEQAGPVAVIGRSGTMVFDCVIAVQENKLGIRYAACLGGDSNMGLDYADQLMILERDPRTSCIIITGEGGGTRELEVIELIEKGVVKKPVIALLAGKSMPGGIKAGHAGAIDRQGLQDPNLKQEILEQYGVICVDNADQAALAAKLALQEWQNVGPEKDACWRRLCSSFPGLADTPNGAASFSSLYSLLGEGTMEKVFQSAPSELQRLLNNYNAFDGHLLSNGLLKDESGRRAFEKALLRHPHYANSLLANGLGGGGARYLNRCIKSVFGKGCFEEALAKTPWACADAVNEIAAFGTMRFIELHENTIGLHTFRQAFRQRPWNTAHAVRSMGNMPPGVYVRAFVLYGDEVVRDRAALMIGYLKNPWAVTRLVRGAAALPAGTLQEATSDPDIRSKHNAVLSSAPMRLLEAGKEAFKTCNPITDERAFVQELKRRILLAAEENEAIDSLSIDQRIERAISELYAIDGGAADILINEVITRDGFERAREKQSSSLYEALRYCCLREPGHHEARLHGVVSACDRHMELLADDEFRRGVQRNPWMMFELLHTLNEFDPYELHFIVHETASLPVWKYCLQEHQWGLGAAMQKIRRMEQKEGEGYMRRMYHGLRAIPGWEKAFQEGFAQNPRDMVHIVQVASAIGIDKFQSVLEHFSLLPAFTRAISSSPRNVARIIELAANGGDDVVKLFSARDFAQLLQNQSAALVRVLRYREQGPSGSAIRSR
ncbi:MAG: hypothetical protein J5J00_02025 [Deltaproteobacteria bacterium]|nr:hypothetical protein [Deltaproteobacteria bacterium]